MITIEKDFAVEDMRTEQNAAVVFIVMMLTLKMVEAVSVCGLRLRCGNGLE